MADEATATGEIIITKPLNETQKPFSRAPTRIAADNYMGKSLTGYHQMKGPMTVHMVRLKSNDIYDELVRLYETHFEAHWEKLEVVMAPHQVPQGLRPHNFMARVYVSSWFIDLYISIRDACMKHEAIEAFRYYEKALFACSHTYDAFLVLLLQSLKPTHIKTALEDALYIPLITDSYNWTSRGMNYFRLNDFHINQALLKSLVRTMKDPSSGWHTAVPSNDPLGRPFWLLDWFEEKAYAWFPEEENYNRDDTNLAFILGVACTPLQATRDKDVYQQFENNEIIEIPTFAKIRDRKTPCRFFGGKTVSVWEKDSITIPIPRAVTRQVPVEEAEGPSTQVPLIRGPGDQEDEEDSGQQPSSKKKKQTYKTQTTLELVDHLVNVKHIVTYMYYAEVIAKEEENVRTAAHKILLFKE